MGHRAGPEGAGDRLLGLKDRARPADTGVESTLVLKAVVVGAGGLALALAVTTGGAANAENDQWWRWDRTQQTSNYYKSAKKKHGTQVKWKQGPPGPQGPPGRHRESG